jgi:hypothetical protein
LLRAIEGYQGHPAVSVALKLAPYVFVRPGEPRGAEWSEIDAADSARRVPAERMNMKSLHVVSLAKQASPSSKSCAFSRAAVDFCSHHCAPWRCRGPAGIKLERAEFSQTGAHLVIFPRNSQSPPRTGW